MSLAWRGSFLLPNSLLISLIIHAFIISLFWQSRQLSGEPSGNTHQRRVRVTFVAHDDEARQRGEEYFREGSRPALDEPEKIPELVAGDKRAAATTALAGVSRMEPRPSSRSAVSESSAPEAPTPEAISEYRLNLARAARGFKQYPPRARVGGLEGVVVVVVTTVSGVGGLRVRLSQSSGVEVLDDEALSILEQAIFVAKLPAGLKGREFALTLPIHFSLDGDMD